MLTLDFSRRTETLYCQSDVTKPDHLPSSLFPLVFCRRLLSKSLLLYTIITSPKCSKDSNDTSLIKLARSVILEEISYFKKQNC